ncbi:type II toxin-antitoxin system RelE/ParE family toxin [Pedobacter cryophilus]|uniref:Type II toxin-antitoxin system RelE/ParE family toxin n=1 Tax=Pedobacter cryophilus TaxID=2571271 RepID=A0A4U1BVG6_9SPHI|nr:type II toxin-antitoxin system RelE/ParE family toxin [Pedobacter cryophilus]TKB96345.1 type II toxin-antitoxin system RelE/ParE family toxin [Pedobacter cryophilus]
MITYKTVLYLKAQRELSKSYEWYEKQKSGLGEKFINQVKLDFQVIAKNPKHYPNKASKYREFVMKNYPYLIIYEIDEVNNEILIASIFHEKRNPKLK